MAEGPRGQGHILLHMKRGNVQCSAGSHCLPVAAAWLAHLHLVLQVHLAALVLGHQVGQQRAEEVVVRRVLKAAGEEVLLAGLRGHVRGLRRAGRGRERWQGAVTGGG